MKISKCDLQLVDEYLKNVNRPDADESTLLLHLDVCVDCQAYLASQAATPEFWGEAAQLFKPGKFDLTERVEFSAGSMGAASLGSQRIREVLDRLTPSDDPHSLGRIGGYEVSGVIGSRAMGVVLKAVDSPLDRVVAVKVMAPHLSNNGSARKRFAREAKAVAAVLHPNVIPIHHVVSEGSNPFLVMAYIRGGSLQKRLQEDGPLKTVEILRIGAQIAAGLSAAHEQGLVHRDIKPENILLEDGVERVTLTDFGLARAVDDASVTREGSISGTPQYMSPEQARGEPIDQASDLFSLGSVLYALCTGRSPFRADSSYGVMRKIIDETATPIRDINQEIPVWLFRIVEKLMAKDKSERFSSADEVRKLLENCLNHLQHPATKALPVSLQQPEISLQPFGGVVRVAVSAIGIMALVILVAVGSLAYMATFITDGPAESALVPPGSGEEKELAYGYSTVGEFVCYKSKRIDRADRKIFKRMAAGRDLKLATSPDAESFEVLNEYYTKDKNMVYLKEGSFGAPWFVEVPHADPATFEVVDFKLGRDKTKVFWGGSPLEGLDPNTLIVVHRHFVWKDQKAVWYQSQPIEGADPRTFTHLGQAYYKDKDRVYWSNTHL
ncbi:MAG: protein kinase, partial [Planctomycetota bacterium]